MQQKEKPFFYLDTHAGCGSYDLKSIQALKTNEADMGINKLLNLQQVPAVLQDYLHVVKACQESPNDYPGSPMIARHLLRPNDRMAAIELHTQDYEKLKGLFARDRQVTTLHQDAYISLKALLPPQERRGLILIDPAFEVSDEFDRIIKGMNEAVQRFKTGIYAIWYPIKDKHEVARFMRKLTAFDLPLLNITFKPFEGPANEGLNETGVVIVNPPWQLDKTLEQIIPVLWKVLSPDGAGKYKIETII